MPENAWLLATGASLLLWLIVPILPGRPWSTRERLEATRVGTGPAPLPCPLTILIPARNEAEVLEYTLKALRGLGPAISVVVIDDDSTDDTATGARRCGPPGLQLVTGTPVPSGWSGKLWALEQGRRRLRTERVLLLDADIVLDPEVLAALVEKQRREALDLVSLMAEPPMQSFWERLLLPAFVYFFKLLYPFRQSNRAGGKAAAAGGCLLVNARMLERIGGFAALRGELIDDCALAGRVKAHGGRTWIGLSRGVRSQRRQSGRGELRAIWETVTRTAYPWLRYSPIRLALCVAVMTLAFAVPLSSLVFAQGAPLYLSLAALAAMSASYLPLLRYYGLSPAWAPTLAPAGLLYLGMTLDSAIRHHFGRGSTWKDRHYATPARP